MRIDTLVKLDELLVKLDREEYTLVKYDPLQFTIELRQIGRVIVLTPIKGLIKVDRLVAILSPEDLNTLIRNIEFLIGYADDLLFIPTDMGYEVQGRDLKYYNRPKVLLELKFYSVKNPLLIKLMALMDKKYKRLIHL